MVFCEANGRLQPGFRFHATDVELVMYYLKRKVLGKRLELEVVAEVDIYMFHPVDLRELACIKRDLYWYFFCPRGKKYGSGDRTNRATHTGYWKATGNGRVVSYNERTVGKIKTLVFHQGKPPKGERTDWVMHEYKLEDKKLADEGVCQDSYVLCKIFKKSGWGPKNGEQYGAPFIEEEWDDDDDDEIPSCAQVLTVDVQNQSTSVVTNSALTNTLVSVNGCPTSTTLEQVYSASASVSAVDHAPTPISTAAANIPSSSKVLIPYYDDAVDQVITPMSMAANWSKDPFPDYNDPVTQATTLVTQTADIASTSTAAVPYYAADIASTSTAAVPYYTADIASTSTAPVPYYDDDEINKMLYYLTPDDFGDMFGSLEDLDHSAAQGSSKSTWTNFCEGGLDLTDLDAPL